ncbi:MAG: hypothetical protein EBR23_14740, partial [Planctomycetia bacterium]|nr:hypothetical protein [Planctomycetia bacterium]
MSDLWRSRAVSPADVVSVVKSGATLFLHGACATPSPLVEALCGRRDLEDVRLYHLHTAGPAPFAEPGREREFRSVSLFTGAPLRRAVNEGRADFVPIFLSDIPALFSSLLEKPDLSDSRISVIPENIRRGLELRSRIGAIFSIAELDRHPEPVVQVAPVFPFNLKRDAIEGRVVVEFVVDTEGRVVGAMT